jgi:hypothetical protein
MSDKTWVISCKAMAGLLFFVATPLHLMGSHDIAIFDMAVACFALLAANAYKTEERP